MSQRRDSAYERRQLVHEVVTAACDNIKPIVKPRTNAEQIALFRRCLAEIEARIKASTAARDALLALIVNLETDEPAKPEQSEIANG